MVDFAFDERCVFSRGKNPPVTSLLKNTGKGKRLFLTMSFIRVSEEGWLKKIMKVSAFIFFTFYQKMGFYFTIFSLFYLSFPIFLTVIGIYPSLIILCNLNRIF